MDYCSKLYIDYLYDSNRYYDDAEIEKLVEKLEIEFMDSLSIEQIVKYEELKKIIKKLRAYKDLHLIKFVIDSKK